MTSTSSDRTILGAGSAAAAGAIAAGPDLRRGEWTRLGGSAVLGDPVTENALADLTERSRKAARAQGYAAGWAEGRRKAIEDAEGERMRRAAAADSAAADARRAQESLVAALAEATARSGEDLVRGYDDLVAQALDLAVGIAQAVLDREIAHTDDAGLEGVRRALTDVPVTAAATVRLHPADLAALDRTVLEGRPLTFVADPGLGRGDALVETETSLVDATVGAALGRVRKALGR